MDALDEREVAPPESAPRSRAAATWATLRTRATALRCLLAGLVAWIITVLPVLAATRSTAAARALGLLALAACVGGSQLIAKRPPFARLLGLGAFIALSLAAWLLGARTGALATVDSFRGLLGVLAWAIYAVSWSQPWSVPDARLGDAPAGQAAGLAPRRSAPRIALAVAAGGTLCAFGCLALAFGVDGSERAVLAQAIAAAAAVSLVGSSASLAAAMGRDERQQGARTPIDRHVVRPLLLFSALAGAAAALRFLR